MGNVFDKLKALFSGSKSIELCLVGLENSGKTTLLSVLSMGHAVDTLPTVGLNVKVMKKKGVTMKVWDLGGQERFRTEWPKYTAHSDVVVFVVDSHDADRVPVAKKELHTLLEDHNLTDKPLCVLLNKIDLEPHMSKEEAVKLLNLDYIRDRPWIVLPISALNNTKVVDVVDWLLEHSK